MPRPYGEKFLRALNEESEHFNLGRELARVCVDAAIPYSYVAEVFGVTRLTVSAWFRGQQIRAARHPRIYAMIAKIKADLDSGRLPATSAADAKEYLREYAETEATADPVDQEVHNA